MFYLFSAQESISAGRFYIFFAFALYIQAIWNWKTYSESAAMSFAGGRPERTEREKRRRGKPLRLLNRVKLSAVCLAPAGAGHFFNICRRFYLPELRPI